MQIIDRLGDVLFLESDIISDNVKLIPATDSDIPNMIEWEIDSIKMGYPNETIPPDEIAKMEAEISKDAKESVRKTRMIRYGDRTIGMLTAYNIKDPAYTGWYIGEIYIIKEFRGQGIGRYLLEKEIEQHDEIMLNVYKANKGAIKLYKSLGFVIVEESDDRFIMKYTRKERAQESYDDSKESEGHLYFYHLLPKDVKLDKHGLKSPDYVYRVDQDMDLYLRMTDKYRGRLVGGWGIYPDKDTDELTADEIYKGINKFRKDSRGNNQIYFFRFPPTEDLGPRMAEILAEKKVVRIDINSPKVKPYIHKIHWGYEGSFTGNKELDRSYYENISREEYFSKYDDDSKMNFAALNHISIDPEQGCLPRNIIDVFDAGYVVQEGHIPSMSLLTFNEMFGETVETTIHAGKMALNPGDVQNTPESTKKRDELIKVDDLEFDEVYFGSPVKETYEMKLDRPLFVTPYKGCASIFAGRIKLADYTPPGSYNLNYDEWALPEKDLMKPLKVVHARVEGYPELEETIVERTGYIHCIPLRDYRDNIYRFHWMSEGLEYLIAKVDKVRVTRVIECTVRYIIKGAPARKPGQGPYPIQEGSVELGVFEDKHTHGKTPEVVCDRMLDKLKSFQYGLPIDGSIKRNLSSKDYDEKYKLLSPEEFEKYGGGICYDYVEYEEAYLKSHSIECKKYFIYTDIPDCVTHTFITVDTNKGYILYPESSFELVAGLHKVEDVGEAIRLIMSKVFKMNGNADKYGEIKYYVWRYEGHPPYGSDIRQCMKYFAQGEPFYEGSLTLTNEVGRDQVHEIQEGAWNDIKNGVNPLSNKTFFTSQWMIN